jgi:tetratricopeptide (TPR) repeat protein/transcriptional regulator with XRE-family HTH domain
MEENTALRQARLAHGWRQVDLAHLLTVHRSTVIRWEHGMVPEAFWQEKLCALFGMNAAQLGFSLDPHSSVSENKRLWFLPYPRNPFFTGREEVLERLHEAFMHDRNALICQCLSGLGGIGKTQTAIEYAYRYAKDYIAVFWISAETNEGIVSSFVAIAELLNLPEKQEKEQSRIIAAVLHWLAAQRDWLVIFDNVEDPALIVLPPARSGSILFTSRRQALGLSAQTVNLGKMSFEEGMSFLFHRTRQLTLMTSLAPEDLALAREIVTIMDSLPLALDQAGAYIEATQCSLSDYLSLFRSATRRLLDERENYMDHPLSVTRTFELIFEQLERKNQSAAQILTVCAFLAPEDIPEMLFIEGAPHLGTIFEELATDPFAFQDAIKTLLAYSLVQRNPRTQTLTIHRLVQAVLKESLPKEVQCTWVINLLHVFSHIFPSDKIQSGYWEICERLLSHVLVVLSHVEQWGINESASSDLLSYVATYLMTTGHFVKSEQLFLKVLFLEESILDEESISDSHIADASYGLGELYKNQGRYEEAELHYQHCLSIRKRRLGPKHPLVARAYNSLAGLNREQGKYKEAEPLYLQALAIWEQEKGPEHILVAYPLHNLGHLYREQGRYEQAEFLFLQALAIWEQEKGPEDPELAFPLQGLGECILAQQRYEEAESLFQRALFLREQTLGPNHPLVSEPLLGLATMYKEQAKYTQAEPLFQRALFLREQTKDSNYSIAEALLGLATMYKEQAKYTQAEPLFQRALEISQQHLVSYHPYIAEISYQLGNSYEMQQQFLRALPLYQQALTIYEQVFGIDHKKTSEIRDIYTFLLKDVNITEERTTDSGRTPL